jgi:hypothetical protein
MKWLAFLLILSSCSSVPYNKKNIDGPVRPYLDDFIAAIPESDHKAKIIKEISGIEIRIVPNISTSQDPDTTESAASSLLDGRCFPPSHRIELDQAMFRDADDDYKQLIIDHELGHCVLHRIHRSGYNPTQYGSISVMSQTFLNVADYNQNKSEFRKELFDSSRFGSLDVLTFFLRQEYAEYKRISRYPREDYEKELNLEVPMSDKLKKLIKEYEESLSADKKTAP